jgi:hypothetical protein
METLSEALQLANIATGVISGSEGHEYEDGVLLGCCVM